MTGDLVATDGTQSDDSSYGATTLVSLTSTGTVAEGYEPSMSADGRTAVLASPARLYSNPRPEPLGTFCVMRSAG
jgi:hypothetical protein